MIKRISIFFLTIILIFLSVTSFGCSKKPLTILYLGDSIAEGIAGISPISERENYSYYGIIGQRNEYIFKNRAVSGHMSYELLELIQREDEDIKMIRTNLKTADIIHVSILGNDLLLADFGRIMLDGSQNDYTFIDGLIANSAAIFEKIVKTIKELNPTACLMFQNVYNPIFEGTWLISDDMREQLTQIDIHEHEYRGFCGEVLKKLNRIIENYLKTHPNSYHIIDTFSEFDNIYLADAERGKNLIFIDGIHPSVEGHAVIADLIQSKLESLKLADKRIALKNYKSMKSSQLTNLYSDSLDVDTVIKQINKANSCSEVTHIFFSETKNKVAKF